MPVPQTLAAPPTRRQPAEVGQQGILAHLPELAEPEATDLVSDDDRFLDVIVLVCVVLFILLAVGIGVLALQAASVSWPY